jgi:hypothetical protein
MASINNSQGLCTCRYLDVIFDYALVADPARGKRRFQFFEGGKIGVQDTLFIL